MSRSLLAVALLGLALAACASTPDTAKPAEGMARAVTQPLRDLNLLREEQAAALTAAAAAPYLLPTDCDGGARELERLNAALGPDIDANVEKDNPAVTFVGDMAVDAVRGAVGLPFRGILRRVTGAERREKAVKRAVFAGALRRAYLKGFAGGARCGLAPDQDPPPAGLPE